MNYDELVRKQRTLKNQLARLKADNVKEAEATCRQFGTTVHAYRLSRGFTQTELAYLVNVSRETISGIERGANNTSVATLIGICVAFGVTPNDLLLPEETTCQTP